MQEQSNYLVQYCIALSENYTSTCI